MSFTGNGITSCCPDQVDNLISITVLTALFELLELTPGMAQLVAQGKEQPVQELQKAIDARVKRLAITRQALQAGFQFWGRGLLDDYATDALRGKLDAAKDFLESLQAFTSPGTLKNFPYGQQKVEAQRVGLDALDEVEAMHTLVGDFANAASYFPAAEAVLPPDHEWVGMLKEVREDLVAQFLDPATRSATGFRQQAQRKLGELKRAYIDAYLALAGPGVCVRLPAGWRLAYGCEGGHRSRRTGSANGARRARGAGAAAVVGRGALSSDRARRRTARRVSAWSVFE